MSGDWRRPAHVSSCQWEERTVLLWLAFLVFEAVRDRPILIRDRPVLVRDRPVPVRSAIVRAVFPTFAAVQTIVNSLGGGESSRWVTPLSAFHPTKRKWRM